MQLIMARPSPYARKIRILLRETGQLQDVEEVEISTSPITPDPQAAAANPTARIPSLIRPRQTTLYDSRVIARYLDDRAGAGLYPANTLWDVLTLEATIEAIMDSAVALSYETRLRPKEKQFDPWVEAHWGKITSALTALQNTWMPYLEGPLNISQISLGAALAYVELRHGHRDWRTGRAALSDWLEAFSKRDSMVDTLPT